MQEKSKVIIPPGDRLKKAGSKLQHPRNRMKILRDNLEKTMLIN